MVSAAQMAQLRSISGNTKFGDDVEWTGANRVSRSPLFFEHAAADGCWLYGATVAAPGHRARPTLPQLGGAEEHLGGVPLLPSFL